MAALTAISMMALPALAAKQPKFDVCHYQVEDERLLNEEGEPVLDDAGNPIVVDPAGWRIININGNAIDAHVGEHTDGVDVDFIIEDDEALAACEALIG